MPSFNILFYFENRYVAGVAGAMPLQFNIFQQSISIGRSSTWLLADELASAPKGEAINKGIEIAGRMIATIKKESICHGVHVMAIGREEVVPDILKSAGLAT